MKNFLRANIYKISYISILLIFVSSCFTEKGNEDIDCGSNQVFNKSTRKCDPTNVAQTTLSQISMNENDLPLTTELVFTDPDGDLPTACLVQDSDANEIEAVAPQALTVMNLEALDAINSAVAADAAVQALAGFATEKTNSTAALNSAQASFVLAKRAQQNSVKLNALRDLVQHVNSVGSIAASTSGAAVSLGSNAISEAAVLNQVNGHITNRCFCQGGICNTVVIPLKDRFGTAGFSYSIATGVDGFTQPRSVDVIINSVNSRPLPVSQNVVFTEENINGPGTIDNINIIPAGDIEGETLNYSFVSQSGALGSTSQGLVTNCMGLNGSSPTDTFCNYQPTSGDSNNGGVSPVVASLSIQGIQFDAKAAGTFGNNISIRYVQNNFSNFFGKEYVEVSGTDITVFIDNGQSTNAEIVNAINADARSTALIEIASSIGTQVVNTQVPTFLTGGVDGYDTFEYTVSDSGGNSVYNGHVSIDMLAQDDPPQLGAQSFTITESATSSVPTYVLTLSPGTDAESALTYTLLTPPTKGNITNCFGGTADIICDYTPNDGNINDITEGITFDTFVVRATANLVNVDTTMSINMTALNDAPQVITPQTVAINESPTAIATTESFTFNLGEDVDNADSEIGIVIKTQPSDGTISGCVINVNDTSNKLDNTATCNYVPDTSIRNGNSLVGTSFVYNLTDGESVNGTSLDGTVNLTITAVDDQISVCEYAEFHQAPECGAGGCVFPETPMVKGIIPQSVGIRYYAVTDSICYRSTGTSSVNDWEIIEDASLVIENQTVNERDSILIDSIRVDEGGGDNSEDGRAIHITGITSSNTVLFPISTGNILIDNVAPSAAFVTNPAGNGIEVGNSAGSAGDTDVLLEFIPVGGQSGSSTITVTFTEVGCPSNCDRTISFVATVNPIVASHNGWTRLLAKGPKIDLFDRVQEQENVCNFSRAKCNSIQDCTGAGNPNSLGVSSDSNIANMIYFDSTNDQCYTSNGASPTVWTAFTSSCNISASEVETGCSSFGGSCINAGAPNFIPTKINSFYYDSTNDVCYRSKDDDAIADWVIYRATSQTELSWEDFTINPAGNAITGYNIYRRRSKITGEGNEVRFDYDQPINKSVLSSTANTYIDNAENSYFAPVPEVVYYYEVRPIVGGIPTNSADDFRTARIYVPGNNLTFAHRWIMNKQICEIMNKDVNSTQNFSCSYTGLGDTTDSRYDIGADLVVDRYEASCPYTASPACSANGCIGLDEPGGNVTGDAGDIYYSRSSGKCYVNTLNASTNWSEFNIFDVQDSAILPDASISNYINSNLPPLTNITQERSNAFCARHVLAKTNVVGLNAGNFEKRLPSRKEQMAYSSWDKSNSSEATIASLETGLSLNSSSKCNSSDASGLASFYRDTSIPDSNSLFSLPGSDSSEIRSVYGGSTETAACTSAMGVQDTIGNVTEWTHEKVSCNNNNCEAILAPVYGITSSASLPDYPTNVGTDTCPADFTGAGSPIGTQAMTAVGQIYLDNTTANGVCYYSTNTSGSDDWVIATTTLITNKTAIVDCPQTNTCGGVGAECSGAGDPSGFTSADSIGSIYADTNTSGPEECYIATTTGTGGWVKLDNRWRLDGITGPCQDNEGDGICDATLTSWAVEEELFGANRYSVAMGIPFSNNYIVDQPIPTGSEGEDPDTVSQLISDLYEIGPTAGITNATLHDDTMIFNTSSVEADGDNCAGIAAGGSYENNIGAGQFHFEFVPCAQVRPDVGFRCVSTLKDSDYIE